MSINAALYGQLIMALAVIMLVLGYYLGRRKTNHPKLTALAAAISAVIPLIALIFLLVLVLKKDLPEPPTTPV